MCIEAHCENCGRPNPELADGYTGCCNELECGGTSQRRWATADNYEHRNPATTVITACCAAEAGKAAKAQGLVVEGLS